ncbi:hypothetical protein BGZ83_011830 [Gryganskiella cystojenkinii]|nr:hypothetical protein BGZ83_011830 [Gryganskiella cystojenkinii]
MSSAYGSIARPVSDKTMDSVLPRHSLLRSNDGADATLFNIADSTTETSYLLAASKHKSLVGAMNFVFSNEVDRGDTYPQEFPLDAAQFDNYFFSGDAFVLLRGKYESAKDVDSRAEPRDWEEDLLGFFYIKPNFPICNGGFMVNPAHRGLGIGSILGKAFLKIVPVLGYKASMFNLVFVSNVASIKLWRRLGFQEIGRIPKAGRLKGQGASSAEGGDNEGYVDAIQFYWDFETMPVADE